MCTVLASSLQPALPPAPLLHIQFLTNFTAPLPLQGFHRPQSAEQREECRRRLAFQELLALQLRLLLQRHLLRLPDREEQLQGVHINNYALVERAVACLPYKLTGGCISSWASSKRRPYAACHTFSRLLTGLHDATLLSLALHA